MGGGRNRNRKRNNRKKGGGKSILERKLLENYLREYSERATYLYHSTVNGVKYESLSSEKSSNNNSSSNVLPTVIDGIELPNLFANDGLLERPYLALPQELSSYHRSMVHDICTDVIPLFHCGANAESTSNNDTTKEEQQQQQRQDRFVAVSIYSDGLAYVPGLGNEIARNQLKIENYRPWIMRNDIDVEAETKKHKERIWELIDQPSECLRDGVDEIDISKQNDDTTLASIPPPKIGDASCKLVDTVDKLEECLKDLYKNKPTELAFDIECYNKSKGQQLTCLIQLATNDGRTYIIDVLADDPNETCVWDRNHDGLANLFADKNIVKIGHGIRGLDIQSLHRDFGIFVVNVFDTLEAATVLDMKQKGLATLCAHYEIQHQEKYKSLKETYQNTDWTKRPLTDEMVLYGRYDVHYLIPLRKLLMRDLVQQAQNQSAEESASIPASLKAIFRDEDVDYKG